MAKKQASKQDSLTKVTTDFDASWEYTSGSWHKRWADNYYLYNNQRVKRGYEGITDTFVPMTFSTIETLTSALFGNKPKFNYRAPSDKKEQKTDILNALLDYFWEKDQWSVKVINTGRSGLSVGTAIDYFWWENDHPVMINVPVRDFFIDPTCTSLETARYMGRRYLITKEELKDFEVVDPETGNMKPKYSNLDQIKEGEQGDTTDKQQKDMWYGSTITNAKNSQIEVLEYWTEDKVISVANRSVVIEDCENYYKTKARANAKKNKDNKVAHAKGLMPFAAYRDYVDPSLFYAKGEIDFIFDQQELLNDITNQNIDSITFTLNQMYTLDPKYAHMVSEIENLPGAIYPVEAQALQPIQQRPIPPDAFNERANIKNEIRETTASNETVKGVGSQNNDTTATEINAQIAGAGQRINLKVTQIENEYFHRMARIVFEMIKLYVTEPMMVRIIGKDGAQWEKFDPKDFQGEYDPQVQLDITIENKKRENAEMAKEMMAAFIGDPDVNQQELKKMVLQRAFDLDPDEVQELIQPIEGVPPEMSMMGNPGAVPPMGAMPPPIPPPMPGGEIPMPEAVPEVPMEPGVEMIPDPVTGELIPVIQDPETGEIIRVEEAMV